MAEETLADKEKRALEVVRGAFRIAAAFLVAALVEVILIALLLLGRTFLGDSFSGLVPFFPAIAALASVPVLPFAREKKYFFFVLLFVLAAAVLVWYFQIALFVLWGDLSATGV